MNIVDLIVAFLFRMNVRGASRFHTLVCGGRRLNVRSKHGVAFKIDPHEYVDGFILRRGYYEEEVLDAIRSSLNPGDVFWDVGSNLGLHALTVAKLNSGSPIFAFEPNPKACIQNP